MEMKFLRVVKKNHVEFPRVFTLGLEISKGANTILWKSLGWNLVLSGISGGKVKNLKSQGFFQKSDVLNPHVWLFSGIAKLKLLEFPRHLSATDVIFSKHIPFTNKFLLSSQYFAILFMQGSLVIATTTDDC